MTEGAVQHFYWAATGPLNCTFGAAQRWESDSTLLPWPEPRAVVTHSLTPPGPANESAVERTTRPISDAIPNGILTT
ncbi:hypothetical protein C8K36_1011477 [Rhodococcus sp. OK519]|nr:hypothetical protein C8K36_1011477 [Rhodococcus sp. OK519]